MCFIIYCQALTGHKYGCRVACWVIGSKASPFFCDWNVIWTMHAFLSVYVVGCSFCFCSLKNLISDALMISKLDQ